MWGPSLALMARALRVDARLLRTHLFRAGFALIIFFSMVFAHLTSLMVGAPGLHFFTSITWLNFVFITLAGMSYFATAITEEKDESILGLLRMAGIGPLSLLLGKSTTRLTTSLLILSVQLPFTFLAVTLGGVTARQVIAVYLALVAYMVLLANLGLFCSVFARGSARAAGLMTLLVLLMLALVPLVHRVLSNVASAAAPDTSDWYLEKANSIFEWLWENSILARLHAILQTGFGESVFSWQVVSYVTAAVGLFALSWATFDRLTDERSTSVNWRDYLAPASSRTGRRKPIRVWKNPFLWKDFYFAAGGRRAMTAKFIIFSLGAGVYAAAILTSGSFDDGSREAFSQWVISMVLIVSAIEFSIYAANLFREEVRAKTLSTLMLLPISTSRIVISKVLCLIPALIPAAAFLVVGCAFARDGLLVALYNAAVSPGVWLVVSGFVLFLHLTAYFSLLVKWGALPLALFVMYFTHSCLIAPVLFIIAMLGKFVGYSELYAAPYVLVAFSVSLVLELLIAQRLEQIATQ